LKKRNKKDEEYLDTAVTTGGKGLAGYLAMNGANMAFSSTNKGLGRIGQYGTGVPVTESDIHKIKKIVGAREDMPVYTSSSEIYNAKKDVFYNRAKKILADAVKKGNPKSIMTEENYKGVAKQLAKHEASNTHYSPSFDHVVISKDYHNDPLAIAHELTHSTASKIGTRLYGLSRRLHAPAALYAGYKGASDDGMDKKDAAIVGAAVLPMLAEETRANINGYKAAKKLYGKLPSKSLATLIDSQGSYMAYGAVPLAAYGLGRLFNKGYHKAMDEK
jgi:hypothetical protein